MAENKPREWRNPYSTGKKPRRSLSGSLLPKKTGGKVAFLPGLMQNPEDLRFSVLKMRDSVRQIQEVVLLMDKTMESIVTIIDFMERFQNQSHGRGGKNKSAPMMNQLMQSLKNVDIRQIIDFLQSPFVQELLSLSEEAKEAQGNTSLAKGG